MDVEFDKAISLYPLGKEEEALLIMESIGKTESPKTRLMKILFFTNHILIRCGEKNQGIILKLAQ